jgi:hypothetical protein
MKGCIFLEIAEEQDYLKLNNNYIFRGIEKTRQLNRVMITEKRKLEG